MLYIADFFIFILPTIKITIVYLNSVLKNYKFIVIQNENYKCNSYSSNAHLYK